MACCSCDSVTPVTSAPANSARYKPSPPQPQPMSSTRKSVPRSRSSSSLAARWRFLASWASSSDCSGVLEIAAAILPVGVEEQRIEPAVEIVMMRHVAARAPARIELAEAPGEVAEEPLQPRPVRHVGILPEHDGEHVGDRALLDHESAVHVGFAELQFGIEQDAPFGGAGGKAHRDRLAGAIAEGQDRAARGGEPEMSLAGQTS